MKMTRSLRFTPRVEQMEERRVPAASINVIGNSLVIIGDNSANAIDIQDNGAGSVSATIDGKSASGTDIRKIVVIGRGGNDTLNYTLTGALTRTQVLAADLGA